MKADQERVKNLLIDTVTLLCKNSLTYDDELCVEGLLGVKVDSKDVFFVHISESFPSALSAKRTAQTSESTPTRTDMPSAPVGKKRPLASASSPAPRNSPQIKLKESKSLSQNIKTEEVLSDDECMVVEPSQLRSPDSVAQQATRVAGQRRVRSPRNHSSSHSQSPSQENTSYQTDHQGFDMPPDSVHSGEYPDFEHVGKLENDGEPPSKRRLGATDSGADGDEGYQIGSQWPNVAAMGEFASQVAHSAFQDSDSQMSGGDLSQPGCSSWPGGGSLQQASDTRAVSGEDPGARVEGSSWVREVFSVETPAGGGYRCDVCLKIFSRRNKCERHRLIHTGERPFACSICQQAFSRTDILYKHRKTKHPGYHPYQCNQCDVAYPTYVELREHTASH